MRAGSGRHRLRARRESGVHAAEGGELRRGVREGAVQGLASRAIRTRRRSCATSSSPICTRSSQWGDARAGARHASPAAAGDGSGVLDDQGLHRRRADRVAKKDAGRRGEVSRRRLSRAGSSRAFPGGAAALRRRAAEGHRRRNAAGARRARRCAGARPQAPPIAEHAGRLLSSSSIRRPLLGDGRGANKPWLQELPDPVTKVCWSSWVEMHPETAAAPRHRARRHRRGEDGERHRARAGVSRTSACTRTRSRSRSARAIASTAKMACSSPSTQRLSDVQWGYGRYCARHSASTRSTSFRSASNGAGGLVLHGRPRRRSPRPAITTHPAEHRRIGAAARPRHRAGDRRVRSSEQADRSARRRECIAGRREPRVSARTSLAGRGRRAGRSRSPTAADQGKNKGMYDPNDIRAAWPSAAGR